MNRCDKKVPGGKAASEKVIYPLSGEDTLGGGRPQLRNKSFGEYIAWIRANLLYMLVVPRIERSIDKNKEGSARVRIMFNQRGGVKTVQGEI